MPLRPWCRDPAGCVEHTSGRRQFSVNFCSVRSTSDIACFADDSLEFMNTNQTLNQGISHSAVRLCIAADIEHYSRFNNLEAARVQERFTEVLRCARRHAGLPRYEVDVQHSGDGQFLVLPPGLDESTVIPAFVTGLSTALRDANANLVTHLCLRLRVAMHRGLLKPGHNGWVGNSAIAVHRFLDSTSIRTALAGQPDAGFGLIVSDTLYQDVIAHGYPGLMPTLFRRTVVDNRQRGFTEQAWVYLAGCVTG